MNITDFAAVEYLNAALAHALELDKKIGFFELVTDDSMIEYPDDKWLAFLEKMIGIQ